MEDFGEFFFPVQFRDCFGRMFLTMRLSDWKPQ